MKVMFCRRNDLLSHFIRAVTWSSWSHVALLNGETAVEAVWPKVRITTRTQLLCYWQDVLETDLPCSDDVVAWEAALSQVGKPYDWKALFGNLFHNRDWHDQGQWDCSCLTAWAIGFAGRPLFRSEALTWVTPQHLFMLFPKG